MQRPHYLHQITAHFKAHPICAILGPRQVGKTTLAKMYAEAHLQEQIRFFDLEKPTDLAQLENAYLTLSRLPHDLIVIDEIQMRPDLFPVLRVLVDEQEKSENFLS